MTLRRALEKSIKDAQANVCPEKSHNTPDIPAHLKLGMEGEDIAVRYLTENGCRVIARNVRYRWGEIDAIAKDGDEIVFVEVRTRSSSVIMPADTTVGPDKLKKLIKSSRTWAESKNYNGFWRIDLIAITMDEAHRYKIEHIRNITEGVL